MDLASRVFAINMYGWIAVTDPDGTTHEGEDGDPDILESIPKRDRPLLALWRHISAAVSDGLLVARAERYVGHPGYVMVEIEVLTGKEEAWRESWEKGYQAATRKRWGVTAEQARGEVFAAIKNLMNELERAGFELSVIDDVESFSLGALVKNVPEALEAARIIKRHVSGPALAPYMRRF